MIPENIKYHKAHTWAKINGKKATIGITDYAQEELGDIVYIELPEIDSPVEANSEMSEIESTKTTSSVIAPLSGTVVEVNEELGESPEVINEDPYNRGWIAIVEISNEDEIKDLLDASDYGKHLEEESK